jgi:type I restriction enzyme S subunit
MPPDITTHGRVDGRLVRRLPAVSSSLERFRLAAGDLVTVRQGMLGRTTLIGEREAGWLYGPSCIRLRPDPQLVDPGYLASYLTHPPVVDWILARANPGTVATLTAATIAAIPVALPSLQEQRTIAATLTELDRQIEVQQQLLDRLTVLRPAVFTELIGEYEPAVLSRPGALKSTVRQRVGRTRRLNRLS